MKTVIPAEEHRSIADMFLRITREFSDKIAFMEKSEGEWKAYSFSDFREQVRDISLGLKASGIDLRDNIAILSGNCLNWALADYGIICSGATTVTIYPTLLPDQVEYLLKDSYSKAVFVQDREQLDKILPSINRLPDLQLIILMQDKNISIPNVITLAELKNKGKDFPDQKLFEKTARSLTRDDPLTIIYTSGTTGIPKGVILTHGNILSNVEAGLRALNVTPSDVLLSFLPLSHSFERTVGHFGPFAAGATVAYAESLERLPQNMLEIRPTLMTGVPRFYEKIYSGIFQQVSQYSILKRKIFHKAVRTGYERYKVFQEKSPLKSSTKLALKLYNMLVYKKLRKRLGGRIRFFISGGAPLAKEIAEFFHSVDILILEAYGLTETSPGISLNREDNYKAGTAGLPLDNVEVKIARDGEILTRGPHVMKGYWKMPEETAEVIDTEGWFHTGDIGFIDDDGFLIITDRKKDILVTSGGKNIAPAPLENQLKKIPLIEQVLVIGDRKKFISALIVPNKEMLIQKARELSIQGDYDELIKSKEIYKIFSELIENAMTSYARYERIKKFRLIQEPFSIDNRLMTPKMSIKRKEVLERYSHLIEEMYAEQ